MEDFLCVKHATLSHINQILDVFVLFKVHITFSIYIQSYVSSPINQ
jgi:hypothetical protein